MKLLYLCVLVLLTHSAHAAEKEDSCAQLPQLKDFIVKPIADCAEGEKLRKSLLEAYPKIAKECGEMKSRLAANKKFPSNESAIAYKRKIETMLGAADSTPSCPQAYSPLHFEKKVLLIFNSYVVELSP